MAKKKKGKDPAFLMYSGDFLAGTYTMNYEQKGKYITLMCIHHQKGFLTEIDLHSVLSDTDIVVASKFYKADNGNYYNQKMIDVIEERKLFTESRRANGNKGGRPKTINKPNGYHMDNLNETYTKPTNNHTGDEDEDENQDRKLEIKNESKSGNEYGVYYKLYKQLTNYETADNVYEDIYFDIQDDIGWDKFYSVLNLTDKEIKEMDNVITIKLK
jgi:hypothetical protein